MSSESDLPNFKVLLIAFSSPGAPSTMRKSGRRRSRWIVLAVFTGADLKADGVNGLPCGWGINMRKVDGWQTLAKQLARALCC
jgi:hypothetical protein